MWNYPRTPLVWYMIMLQGNNHRNCIWWMYIMHLFGKVSMAMKRFLWSSKMLVSENYLYESLKDESYFYNYFISILVCKEQCREIYFMPFFLKPNNSLFLTEELINKQGTDAIKLPSPERQCPVYNCILHGALLAVSHISFYFLLTIEKLNERILLRTCMHSTFLHP